MQQDTDQAEKVYDNASTGGMSSLDINFLSDFENGTDTLDTSRGELSQEMMKKMGADSVKLPAKTSGAPEKIKEKPMKKVSRVFDVQKNNQV